MSDTDEPKAPPAPAPMPHRGGPASEQLPPWAVRELEELRGRAKQLEQLQAAKAQAEAKAQELEQRYRATTQRLTDREMDLAMVRAGGDFEHEDVRRFFRDAYRGAVSELPDDKRPEFDAWFGGEAVRKSPLYSRFFAPPAAPQQPPSPQAPAAPPAYSAPPPPPNVDAGAGAGQAQAPGDITPTQIAAWGKDPSTWRRHREQAAKALAEKYRGVGGGPKG